MANREGHKFEARIAEGEAISDVLASSKGSDWLTIFEKFPDFFGRVAEKEAEALRATLRRADQPNAKGWPKIFWRMRSYSWELECNFRNGLRQLPVEHLSLLRGELAYELLSDGNYRQDVNNPDLLKVLSDDPLRREVAAMLDKAARMWVALRRISETNDYSEREKPSRIALDDYVMRLVEDSPILWAESLHLILARTSEIGDLVELITITLTQSSPEVQKALQHIADNSDSLDLREYARGLLLLAESADHPRSEAIRRLIDSLARWSSVGVTFPHPLSPISRTWLASHDAEEIFRSGLEVGLEEFRKDFVAQGVKNERALVERLLTEMSVPFRQRGPTTRAFGRLGQRMKPCIKLDHRTLVESEETRYGPDIAFLVHTTLHGSMTMELAEFVQVKKPGRYRERWKSIWTIDAVQLSDLIKTSHSSVYWLIDQDGKVCVVPAKYVCAWKPAKVGKTFTLGFNAVRSVAIPVEQFLVELIVGAWLGSSAPNAINIARGQVAGLIPVKLVEVTVSLQEDQAISVQ